MDPKQTETDPKWTEIKLFGVGRPGGLSGWGGVGVVRENESHYKELPIQEGCFEVVVHELSEPKRRAKYVHQPRHAQAMFIMLRPEKVFPSLDGPAIRDANRW